MGSSVMLLAAIFLPIVFGVILLICPQFNQNRTILLGTVFIALGLSVVCTFAVVFGADVTVRLLPMGGNLVLYFHPDALGKLFAVVISVIWLLAGIFSVEYMKHEREEKRYFGFYVMVYGILMALSFAGNLVTFYAFYEAMTLTTLPLVMHTKTREAIMAGLKYLLYSLCGAYMVLFGIYFLNRYASTLDFQAGGTLQVVSASQHPTLLLVVAFFMILGFGVKAGMFPMHAWLPAAHPVAPAPASAVLSGIIVKMGVLGIIRAIFYIIGADFVRDTWVQTAWLTLALLTVFMGSMLAYREKIMKKRLAYSTVSQISYILFGLALLQPTAMIGSLLHFVFHACIKSCLFLSAGAIIYKTGKTNVDELTGIGKQMPITIWCYTFASMALIGIPPASGFISKWYLANGALASGIETFAWLGPVVLLISALLTAGYLLPITIHGFLPGAGTTWDKQEPAWTMLVPLFVLAAASLLLGLFPNALAAFLQNIVQTVL